MPDGYEVSTGSAPKRSNSRTAERHGPMPLREHYAEVIAMPTDGTRQARARDDFVGARVARFRHRLSGAQGAGIRQAHRRSGVATNHRRTAMRERVVGRSASEDRFGLGPGAGLLDVEDRPRRPPRRA